MDALRLFAGGLLMGTALGLLLALTVVGVAWCRRQRL